MATELEPKSADEKSGQTSQDKIAKDIHTESERLAKKERIPHPQGVNGKSKILWSYLVPVLLFHLLIPLAFFEYFFSWWGLLFLPIGNYFFTSLGIGAGYHRLLTHRGFECPKWFEYTLTVLGVCSFQDSPARWVLVHRVHHQHSDHQPDPHTPHVSAFWAHMGWLFIDNQDLSSASAYDKYTRDLMRDPFYMWLQRNLNWVWVFVAHALVFLLVGYGLSYWFAPDQIFRFTTAFFFWTVIMRTVYTWHVTWAINSAAHMWGYRNYETREDSRNNWLFAILTNGEGWHNNHHADPRSAQHGHRWWELDLTFLTLVFFEKIGVIKKLARPHRSGLARRAIY
ncbi:MAG: fatty acid desaturase [Planctomycetota bacterium]